MNTVNSRGRVGRVVLALALMIAGTAGIGPVAATAAAAEPPGESPVDLVSVALDSAGELSLRLRTADRQRHDPAMVPLPVTTGTSGGTTGAVPDLPAYEFLGSPGRPVWALAAAGTDFPAWDTTGVAPARLAAAELALELVSADGPGGFHAYTISPVGEPRLLFGTSAAAPRQAELPAGTRQGGAIWVFDTPGLHQVTLAVSATLASGETTTDRATYRVEVPPLPGPETDPVTPGAASTPDTLSAPPVGQLRRLAAPEQSPPGGDTGSGQVVIADGHVDIGPRIVDGAWTVQLNDDTVSPHVWRDLPDVVLHVVDAARIEVPAGGDFEFLGEPGDPVWLLPQAQQAGIVWPGWNTEHESVVSEIEGSTTWTLREVAGPGEFALFLTGSFGQPEVRFTSRDDLPQSMSIPLRTHAHGNWAFTEPGVYHLQLEVSATTTDGEQLSDTRVLAFAVGDATDPDTAFPPPGDGGGDGDGDGGGGGLARTGLRLVPLLLVGAALLGGGALLLVLTRRRRSRAAGA